MNTVKRSFISKYKAEAGGNFTELDQLKLVGVRREIIQMITTHQEQICSVCPTLKGF